MIGKLFGSKDQPQFGGEIRIADVAFRDSALLMKLLEAEGATEQAKSLLASTSAKWRQSSQPRLRTTGISLLRFLFKAMQVTYSKPLLDETLDLFTSSNTGALAARDYASVKDALIDQLHPASHRAQRNSQSSGLPLRIVVAPKAGRD